MTEEPTVTEPEAKGRRGHRYHTDACGRATTSRCRCACGGSRHGELLRKPEERPLSEKERKESDRQQVEVAERILRECQQGGERA